LFFLGSIQRETQKTLFSFFYITHVFVQVHMMLLSHWHFTIEKKPHWETACSFFFYITSNVVFLCVDLDEAKSQHEWDPRWVHMYTQVQHGTDFNMSGITDRHTTAFMVSSPKSAWWKTFWKIRFSKPGVCINLVSEWIPLRWHEVSIDIGLFHLQPILKQDWYRPRVKRTEFPKKFFATQISGWNPWTPLYDDP